MTETPYCRTPSENGFHADDPSEDALFDLIGELNATDNTFLVIEPDEDDPTWFATVAVLDEGGYEIVLRDSTRREHQVTPATDIGATVVLVDLGVAATAPWALLPHSLSVADAFGRRGAEEIRQAGFPDEVADGVAPAVVALNVQGRMPHR